MTPPGRSASRAVALLAAAFVGWAGPAAIAAPCAKSQLRLVNSIREVAQPYHANLDKGGRMFAAWAGIEKQYVLQLNQGESDRQVSLMRTLLAASDPGCVVFNVEPNADIVVRPMVDTADRTGASLVTHWAHNKGLHPFDGHDHWIAHLAVDSQAAGVAISEKLLQAMGETGGIVALLGRLDTDPAQKRFAGLEQVLARHPGVALLDQQTANWDRTKAFPIMQTWLARYGDRIRGVWAANDDMALGALEALRADGRAGKVPVVGVDGIPEAIAAIQRGDMVATVSSDAYYQGSIGFAIGLCVLTGEVAAPVTWSKDHREYYLRLTTITRDNASEFLNEPSAEAYIREWGCDALWGRNAGPAS